MNERDSEAVAAQLVAKGYTLAGSEATADVILLNTCSVRDMAQQKALNKSAGEEVQWQLLDRSDLRLKRLAAPAATQGRKK